MIFKSQNSDLTFKLIFGSVYLFLFGIGIFGYFQTNNFNELPGSYQGIIAGVFIFYFGKDFVRGTKIVVDEDNK